MEDRAIVRHGGKSKVAARSRLRLASERCLLPPEADLIRDPEGDIERSVDNAYQICNGRSSDIGSFEFSTV